MELRRWRSFNGVGPCTAIVTYAPGWGRFLLIVCPVCLTFFLLAGLIADGCPGDDYYVSSAMNNDFCVTHTGAVGGMVRMSSRMNRWLLWHCYFTCEIVKRFVYLPRSILRNVYIVAYSAFGLGAVYFFELKSAHVVFGTGYMLTGTSEISLLWWPCCGPPLGPCFPASCCRPDTECCRKPRWGAIAVGVYVWIHALTFMFLQAGPILQLFENFMIGSVRVNEIAEWTLVVAFQWIHWCRAPVLAAAKYGAGGSPRTPTRRGGAAVVTDTGVELHSPGAARSDDPRHAAPSVYVEKPY